MSVTVEGFHKNKPQEKSPIRFIQKGVTTLRVLPAYSDEGRWCYEVKEHTAYLNGKYAPQVCIGLDDGCPWCIEGHRLYNEGGEENIEKSKELRPRRSYLFNVIFMNGPDEGLIPNAGVLVLKAGVKVKNQIFDLDSDVAGGYGNITDINEGFDLRITRTGTGRFDTEYQVKAVPQRTSLVKNLEAVGFDGEIKPHDLSQVLSIPTQDFAEKVFNDNFDAVLDGIGTETALTEEKPNIPPPPSPVESSSMAPPPPPPVMEGN